MAIDSLPGGFVKYHAQRLFKDLITDAVNSCLERLRRQPEMYKQASHLDQKKMQCRALNLAAVTLKTTAILTAKLLQRGTFSMITQRRFFWKRWRRHPDDWGANAKSCFARALSGYSIGADAVCIDRHLERLGIAPVDAPDQWKRWFDIYETMYGAGEAGACVLWHADALDWIALKRVKPVAWK